MMAFDAATTSGPGNEEERSRTAKKHRGIGPTRKATPPRRTPQPSFGWKQFLLWCLPALIIGAALRGALLVAIPEAYFGGDSQSYFQPRSNCGAMAITSFSTRSGAGFIPFFVCHCPRFPSIRPVPPPFCSTSSDYARSWASDGSWRNVTRLRPLWVFLVTMLAALDLDMLRNEHELIGNSFFLAALSRTRPPWPCLPSVYHERRRLSGFFSWPPWWSPSSPHGRGIWIGSILAATVHHAPTLALEKPEAWAAVGLGVVMILNHRRERQAVGCAGIRRCRWSISMAQSGRNIAGAQAHGAQGENRFRARSVPAWNTHEYKNLGRRDPPLIESGLGKPRQPSPRAKAQHRILRVCSDLARDSDPPASPRLPTHPHSNSSPPSPPDSRYAPEYSLIATTIERLQVSETPKYSTCHALSALGNGSSLI